MSSYYEDRSMSLPPSSYVSSRTRSAFVLPKPQPVARLTSPTRSKYENMSSVRYSSYQSTMPMSLNRSVRSSSVERSYYGTAASYGTAELAAKAAGRWNRARTVGPESVLQDPDLYGVMPFNRSLVQIEDQIKMRASSLEPVSTYRRSYTNSTPYGATTTYDYKVLDYASHLDREENTRNYMNTYRSNYYSSGPADSYANNPLYNSYGVSRPSSGLNLDAYKLDSRALYTYRHYRKSNATLINRNERAKSPVQGRELDRYYNTSRRANFMYDLSSGGHNDFRYYNFRSVPYYGGSDYYTLTTKKYLAGYRPKKAAAEEE